MGGEHLFHRSGREPVAGDVDDVVHATHDVEVAVLVLVARVAREVVVRVLREIRRLVARVVVPEGRQATGRQREPDRERADLARGHLVVVLAQRAHLVAGHGLRGRAGLHREHPEADAVGGDRPARLGLPPVVDHRHAEVLARPHERVGVAALAGEEERAEPREVVLRHVRAPGVLLLDRAERGRRREEHVDAVLRDEAPEGAGIRRPHGLALVEDRRATLEQRRVDDVRVTHDPPDVRRRPVHLARADAVDPLHGPLEGDRVATVVPHDTLRHARRARRVEDVEWIGRGHGHALGRWGTRHEIAPVEVAPADERRRVVGSLEDHAALWLVRGQVDRAVEERLVGDDAVHLDAARGREDEPGLGVVDALGELVRREATEDHRVDRADARARQHGHHRLRHHRHVDDDPVALRDPLAPERAGDARDRVTQLVVGEDLDGAGDGTVVDERALLAAPALDVEVERVVAGVEDAAREPADERFPRVVEDAIAALLPVNVLRRPRPETLRVFHRAGVDLVVDAPRHRRTSLGRRPGAAQEKYHDGRREGEGPRATRRASNVESISGRVRRCSIRRC